MKKLVLATLVSLSVSSVANAALEKNVKYVGDMAYAGFCKAVIADNVGLFKRSVRRFVGPLGGTKQDVLLRVLDNKNVQCAGQGLVEFAQQRNAKQVVAYLNNQSA